MTATLVSGTAKQVCATVLLGGVWATTPTAGGTTASGTTANPSISISPASAGELAFAVLGIRGTTAPTAVTGTGATAPSLYGIGPTPSAPAPNSICGARPDPIQLGPHGQRPIRDSRHRPGPKIDHPCYRRCGRAPRGDDRQSRRIELDGQRAVD